MCELINIIPEVRSLQLINVGPWKEASLEFSPGINIIRNISGGRGGCGKSVIMRSLLPLANKHLTSRIGSADGTIHIEYARPQLQYALPAFADCRADETASWAAGEKIMQMLRQALNQAKPGCCLCFDDDVFGCLDAQKCAGAITIVNQANSQFVFVLPSPVNSARFRAARVFECAYDDVTESATIQVRGDEQLFKEQPAL